MFSLASSQPPSGGCVLKLEALGNVQLGQQPAAFGRLCVETIWSLAEMVRPSAVSPQPPSGGCVLKRFGLATQLGLIRSSRLRAAVCLNGLGKARLSPAAPSRLRAAVC